MSYEDSEATFISSGSETDGSKKKFKCSFDGCSVSYNRQWKLNRHICVHTKERPFKCEFDTCSKSYTCNSHLQRHVANVHKEKNPPVFLPCPYPGCSKLLSNKYSLKKHCKTHVKKVAYECTTCKATFKKHNQYNAHLFVHTGIHPFSCGRCGSNFMTKTDLTRHERRYKTYACSHEGCDIVCNTWTQLREHTSLHSRYTCDRCGKVFMNKSALQEHVLSHVQLDNRDVFICPHEECPRYYFHKRNLKSHIESYHQRERYACREINCGKSFAFKSTLLQHIIKHDEQLPLPKVRVRGTKKPRKDKGVAKRSMAGLLSGVVLPLAVDKQVTAGSVTNPVNAYISDALDRLQEEEVEDCDGAPKEETPPPPPQCPPANLTVIEKSVLFVVSKQQTKCGS